MFVLRLSGIQIYILSFLNSIYVIFSLFINFEGVEVDGEKLEIGDHIMLEPEKENEGKYR